MQIYFCIDYDHHRLSGTDLWESLNPPEQAAVQGFLQSLGQFSFEQFQRFPIFGACDPQQIDSAWCADIAQTTHSTAVEVAQTLSRSVSIIPTSKAEAFLVHDIWGHHWQLFLTQFESDYHTLRACSDPLRAAETAYTAEGPLSCRELFTLENQQVRVDPAKARMFFRSEVQQRLGLLFTHLTGELLADMAEFKFVDDFPTQADQLLSSSLFKAQPTKLDLSLADLDFLFLQVLRSLLDVQLSIVEASVLEQDLLTEWQGAGAEVESLETSISLKQAILEMHQIFLEEYNATYLPTLTGEIGIFTQIVSNLLYLQNGVDTLYDAVDDFPFRDLLMLFIGCYCAKDSYAEFWAIDDVLANYFLPCWHHLDQALSGDVGNPSSTA